MSREVRPCESTYLRLQEVRTRPSALCASAIAIVAGSHCQGSARVVVVRHPCPSPRDAKHGRDCRAEQLSDSCEGRSVGASGVECRIVHLSRHSTIPMCNSQAQLETSHIYECSLCWTPSWRVHAHVRSFSVDRTSFCHVSDPVVRAGRASDKRRMAPHDNETLGPDL